MGLRSRCTSCAVRRAHALLVEVPGWWTTRVAAERQLRRRGWQPALSPADADVLVVCGNPADRLGEAIERVWEQLPGPRALVRLASTDAAAALDEAAHELGDDSRQRADARTRRPLADDGTDHGDVTQGDMDHGDMDHGDMDHGDMDHGDMDMAPAGIALAGGGEDRDGLEMDVLHVPLGPVLPHWPAGLVLRCVLHGDVVAEAEVEVLDGRGLVRPAAAAATPVLAAASACDGAAQLLAVAGWEDAADAARRVRDLVLDGPPGHEQAVGRLDRLHARVRRLWLLRWQLRGLGSLDEDLLGAHGLASEMRGDVHDRLVAMLGRARVQLRDGRADPVLDPGATLAALPTIVAGLEIGAVRLVVASLHPDTAGVLRWEHPHA